MKIPTVSFILILTSGEGFQPPSRQPFTPRTALRVATLPVPEEGVFAPLQQVDHDQTAHGALDAAIHQLTQKLSTWNRRLDTKMDKLDVHKYAGGAFSISSSVLLLTGLSNNLSTIPDHLGPMVMILLASTVAQAASSIPMCLNYRKETDPMRDAFLVAAMGTVLGMTGSLVLSPFCPDFLAADHTALGKVLMGGLAAVDGLGALHGARMSSLISATRLTGPDKHPAHWFAFESYHMVAAVITSVILGLVMTPGFSREVFYDFCGPQASIHAFYYSIFQATCVGYSALALTLRNKKLISATVERTLIAGMNGLTFASLLAVVAEVAVRHVSI